MHMGVHIYIHIHTTHMHTLHTYLYTYIAHMCIYTCMHIYTHIHTTHRHTGTHRPCRAMELNKLFKDVNSAESLLFL